MVEDSQAKLEKYCEENIPKDIQWTAMVRERQKHHSHHEILAVAEELESDLIIVGDHDKHGLERWLGTNSDKVVRRAHCSVMVVKEKRL